MTGCFIKVIANISTIACDLTKAIRHLVQLYIMNYEYSGRNSKLNKCINTSMQCILATFAVFLHIVLYDLQLHYSDYDISSYIFI